MSDENNMPKGRERPTGPCDCGRIEHGRHHADCPASGVSYSDKYAATPAADNDAAEFTAIPLVATETVRVKYHDAGEMPPMRHEDDGDAAPHAAGEPEADELMRVVEELEKLAAERSMGFVAAAVDQLPAIASAIRRLAAANAELAKGRDAAREEAKRLREALEPFVRAFLYVHRDPHAHENEPGFREFLDVNEVIPRQMSSEEVLSVGHFRHAALATESAALSAVEQKGV